MSTSFKTCMFGGFDREDVISYIEKSARETQERIEALETENCQLKSSNEQIEQALRTLRAQASLQQSETQEREVCRQQLEEAQAQVAALTDENQRLAARNEALQAAADECARLKERIADIEINAHRRTEEFRSGAIASLRQSIAEQRAWCQAKQEQYALLNEQLLHELRRAEDILDNGDMSGFDNMLASLQALEDTLQ